jgi:hypothetical protein
MLMAKERAMHVQQASNEPAQLRLQLVDVK